MTSYSTSIRFQSTPLMRGATHVRRYALAGGDISIHAPHARGDRNPVILIHVNSNFNPHPSCEGRLLHDLWQLLLCRHFNPRPSCEGRLSIIRLSNSNVNFNPRPSCEGRPIKIRILRQMALFQSTPLMRGATMYARSLHHAGFISIHAPHARGDLSAVRLAC